MCSSDQKEAGQAGPAAKKCPERTAPSQAPAQDERQVPSQDEAALLEPTEERFVAEKPAALQDAAAVRRREQAEPTASAETEEEREPEPEPGRKWV